MLTNSPLYHSTPPNLHQHQQQHQQQKKKMLVASALLAFLFLLTFFKLPRKKFIAWLLSCFGKSASNVSTDSIAKIEEEEEEEAANKQTKKKSASAAHNKADLRTLFATFDKNNDGYITKQELRESLKNIGILMEDKDVAQMVQNVDSNGDGLIDLDEFYELLESMENTEEGEEETRGKDLGEAELKEAFDVFDGDGDGLISVGELGLVLSSLGFKEGNRMEDCREMIRKVDMDGDGMVNFHEFKKMMKSSGGTVLVPGS